MQGFPKKDYKLFKSIVSLTQKELHIFLYNVLQKKYNNIINADKYLIAIGDIPVGLIAHMDTVFKSPPRQIYFDNDFWTFWSPDGLGADDRAGIYIILKILQTNLRPTIIFTEDEEIGGIGASKLVKNFPKPPTDLKYLIQLDRRNDNDAVFYDCGNVDFIKYIESFGFKYADGLFSDISIICPYWNLAGVNLSVGYNNEHSYIETCNIKATERIFKKVYKILSRKNHKYYDYQELDSNWLIYDEKCDGCKQVFFDYEMIPVDFKDGSRKYFCPDCAAKKVDWCQKCGSPFLKKKNKKICYRCYSSREKK